MADRDAETPGEKTPDVEELRRRLIAQGREPKKKDTDEEDEEK